MTDSTITAAVLHSVMPHATAPVLNRYLQPLSKGMIAHEICTPLRQAHFLAQIAHESCDLLYSEELGSGEAYNGRLSLGNDQPGDGPRFKGRGLIQITGRVNYSAYGRYKGRDFTTTPNYELLATDPELAADVSCWFWKQHGLNELADANDVAAITKRINGGLNGFEDRKARLLRAKSGLLNQA